MSYSERRDRNLIEAVSPTACGSKACASLHQFENLLTIPDRSQGVNSMGLEVAEADQTLLCLRGEHGIGADEGGAFGELDSRPTLTKGHLPFSGKCVELRGLP